MKTITLHTQISREDLFEHLQQRLNPLFRQQRQTDLSFTITDTPGGIQITQPELYDGVLFNIAVAGTDLHITRSEHYVDDVNSITIESILNILFDDLSGGQGTDLVQEG